MFCQYPSCTNLIERATQSVPQAVTGPGSTMTIILIVVFVASLAFGLLFLLGVRRQPRKSAGKKEPQQKPPPPMGHAYGGLDTATNLLFNGLISLYKWAFNYNGQPAAPAAITVISEEPSTRAAMPPSPAATTIVSKEPCTRAATPPPPESLPESLFPAPSQPTYRPYGLQAIIDIMGEGIENALDRMVDGIYFIFDGLINLFKWIFRIDR